MQDSNSPLLPTWIQRALMLICTLTALALYAGVLGTAIIRTFTEDTPQFNINMVRAASMLSGLIGAVVTAGFARSQVPVTLQAEPDPLLENIGPAPSTKEPDKRIARKLHSLAATLGLMPIDQNTQRTAPSLDTSRDWHSLSAVEWVALLYFVVYFAVGITAFTVTLLHADVHDMVTNAGWVWLGTAISSTYSYLGLNTRD